MHGRFCATKSRCGGKRRARVRQSVCDDPCTIGARGAPETQAARGPPRAPRCRSQSRAHPAPRAPPVSATLHTDQAGVCLKRTRRERCTPVRARPGATARARQGSCAPRAACTHGGVRTDTPLGGDVGCMLARECCAGVCCRVQATLQRRSGTTHLASDTRRLSFCGVPGVWREASKCRRNAGPRVARRTCRRTRKPCCSTNIAQRRRAAPLRRGAAWRRARGTCARRQCAGGGDSGAASGAGRHEGGARACCGAASGGDGAAGSGAQRRASRERHAHTRRGCGADAALRSWRAPSLQRAAGGGSSTCVRGREHSGTCSRRRDHGGRCEARRPRADAKRAACVVASGAGCTARVQSDSVTLLTPRSPVCVCDPVVRAPPQASKDVQARAAAPAADKGAV